MAKKKTEEVTAPPAYILDVAVEFGDVSIGDHSCRLGLGTARENLDLNDADRQLCGRRLVGKIVARSSGGPDQDSIPGMESDAAIYGAFDVKRLSFTPKHINFGVTLAIEDLDLATLGRFAKRSGRLVVTESADIPAKDTHGGESDGDE